MAEVEEVEIVRHGAQGDGVADTADGPCFVPLALPGERVRIAREGKRVRLVEVVRASADRASPVCRHFGACGGCTAQHMAAGLYRGWKRNAVIEAFAHRGLEANVGDVVQVPAGSRRRATVEARRDGGQTVLGFHAAGTHDVVDLAECPVLVPAIVAALPALREMSHTLLGETGTCRLTVTAAGNGLDVAVESAAMPGAETRARISQIAARAGVVRLTLAGDIVVQREVPVLRLGGAEVRIPPAAFLQASAAAEAAMTALMLDAVGKAKRIADLFCGVGTFTFALAARGRVLAMDGDKAAIAALKEAATRAQGLKPIDARVRDLMREPLSRTELEEVDAVVFDPPRAGAKAQAEMLAKSKVPAVVAVSCNPATLARDVRMLVDGGYRIESVTPIDQFVWSEHVEAVVVLRRAKPTGRMRR